MKHRKKQHTIAFGLCIAVAYFKHVIIFSSPVAKTQNKCNKLYVSFHKQIPLYQYLNTELHNVLYQDIKSYNVLGAGAPKWSLQKLKSVIFNIPHAHY